MSEKISYKILVCGGREYNNRENVFATLDEIKDSMEIPIHIISGAARGADALAAEWARLNNTELSEFPADWDAHGKSAGPIRNQKMLQEGKPDLVLAFPGGRGTQHMLRIAKFAGVSTMSFSEKEDLWEE